MPVTCPINIRSITRKEFAELDYEVMRCAFASQNELGRLCDEGVYRNDLAARLRAAGLGPVHQEVPLTVALRDFVKVYRMDLVVSNAAVYELKTENRLAADHEAQVLNYLFLSGSTHGRLINLRPPQVESRFVNNALTPEARRRFEVDTRHWHEPDERSRTLRTVLLEVLGEWGNLLETALYTEAMLHFLGGEENVAKMVPLRRNGVALGNQRFHLVGPEIAFRITALQEGTEEYERQLQSLLWYSPLRAMQWINLGRQRIEFVTLMR